MSVESFPTAQGVTVTFEAPLFSMKEVKKDRASTMSASVCLAEKGVTMQIDKMTDLFATAKGVTVKIHTALFLMFECTKERASTVSALVCLTAEGATLQKDILTDMS